MPIIHVEMLAGRSSEAKHALAEQLTEAVVNNLAVSPEAVRVVLHEVAHGNWFVAGRPLGTSLPGASISETPVADRDS